MSGLPVPHYLLEGTALGLILCCHYLEFLILERVDLHFHFGVELANYVAKLMIYIELPNGQLHLTLQIYTHVLQIPTLLIFYLIP